MLISHWTRPSLDLLGGRDHLHRGFDDGRDFTNTSRQHVLLMANY